MEQNHKDGEGFVEIRGRSRECLEEEVAPVSTERTLTHCVMLEQSPEGFKEIIIRAAGPAQRHVLFQKLK